jgi:hypothetical protein
MVTLPGTLCVPQDDAERSRRAFLRRSVGARNVQGILLVTTLCMVTLPGTLCVLKDDAERSRRAFLRRSVGTRNVQKELQGLHISKGFFIGNIRSAK